MAQQKCIHCGVPVYRNEKGGVVLDERAMPRPDLSHIWCWHDASQIRHALEDGYNQKPQKGN
jgi:hypothetical protein